MFTTDGRTQGAQAQAFLGLNGLQFSDRERLTVMVEVDRQPEGFHRSRVSG